MVATTVALARQQPDGGINAGRGRVGVDNVKHVTNAGLATGTGADDALREGLTAFAEKRRPDFG